MKLSCTLAAIAVFTMTLDAQEGRRRGRGRGGFGLNADVIETLLKKYDKNDDGKIDRKEYPRSDAAFANLDRDKNGAIEKADLEARPQRGRGRGNRSRGERQAPPKLPQAGDVAPDFDLPFAEQKKEKGAKQKTVKLSSFAGKKPVALIFGSYT